jgi:hypothetical protein
VDGRLRKGALQSAQASMEKIGAGEKGGDDGARWFLKRSWRRGAVGGGGGSDLGAPRGGGRRGADNGPTVAGARGTLAAPFGAE